MNTSQRAIQLSKADPAAAGLTLEELRKKLIETAQEIIAEYQGEGRAPSADEADALGKAADRVTELDKTIQAAKRSAGVAAQFKNVSVDHNGNVEYKGSGERMGRIDLHSSGRKAATRAISSKMGATDALGQKAIASPGTTVTDIPLTDAPYDLGRIATSALDVIPAIQRGAIYAYLRQVTRENNAAVVATGALKPTSKMSLERIESHLKVVAHLSDPVDKFWLEDAASLTQFVQNELVGGLAEALERLVISGTAPEVVDPTVKVTGILGTSGIQLVDYAVDRTTTIRKAITALENVGHIAGVVLLSPFDWEAIELARRSDGQFDAGSALPVARAELKLWGVSVGTSLAVPSGTGLVIDKAAVAVGITGAFEVKWSENVGDDFNRNQLRCRVETRANVDVFAPLGVAKVSLTA
ncbi:phage major capsid protein [Rhodococcus sp. H29-C3]|uniref:phage major capsid protein n=1 Tax=Rhodococcus sp. H29-C3 TaxID=3046307 RepID=UPI0024BA5A06|nr:phage major capsid protein [Rhodococcus sp. H29-C3]MDJ0361545.1 phage major capsid protein [Rhodococcus sp. H29-C3]